MYKEITIILLTAIIFIMGFHSCNVAKSNSKNQVELINLLGENDNLKKSIDSQKREITEVKAVVLVKDKEIQKAIKEIDRLKNLDSKTIFITRTKYDTINVVLHDTTIIDKTDTTQLQKFEYQDRWLSMAGMVKKKSIYFDSLIVQNEYLVEIGDVKKGLFKREKVAFIRNENPYSKTMAAQTFILKEEKKWYQRDVYKFVAGGVAAMVLLSL